MLRSICFALPVLCLVATPVVAEQRTIEPTIITAEDDAKRHKCKSRETTPRTYLETSKTVDEPGGEIASVQKKGKKGCGFLPALAGLGLLAVATAITGPTDNTQ